MPESFKTANIQQAKEMLKSQSVTVVDIRDPESFEEDHIKGAISLNRDNIKDFIEKTDKTVTVLCYCYRGISSQEAARILLRNGFQEVYNLQGGFEAWRSYQ